MNVIETGIDGLVIIEPRIFRDPRGYFFESFSQREFSEKVSPVDFVQDNESRSSYGVLRGLHFQKPPFAQAKLVRVIKGRVLDVAVDLRTGFQFETVNIDFIVSRSDNFRFNLINCRSMELLNTFIYKSNNFIKCFFCRCTIF